MQLKSNQDMGDSLGTLHSNVGTSQSIIIKTDGRIGDILQSLDQLRLDVDKSQPVLFEMQDRIDEVQRTTTEMNLKAAELQHRLPVGMNMIEDTLRKVLAEFHGTTSSQPTEPRVETNPQTTFRQQEFNASCSSNMNSPKGYGLELHKFNRQKLTKCRTYWTWFGKVNIRSTMTETTTTVTSDNDSFTTNTTVTHTTINVHLRPSFLRLGVLFSNMAYQSTARPATDMKLRVYNIVDENALIIDACRAGDLLLVQKLFVGGLATPFDQLPQGHSLLNVILTELCSLWHQPRKAGDLGFLHRYCNLFIYLADLGLDPGASRTLSKSIIFGPALQSLAFLMRGLPSEAEPVLTNLIRFIIERSSQDPFLETRNDEIQCYEQIGAFQCPLLTRQSHWEVKIPPKTAVCSYILCAYEFNGTLHNDPRARKCQDWLWSMDTYTRAVEFLYKGLCLSVLDMVRVEKGLPFDGYLQALVSWFVLLLDFELDVRRDDDDLLYFLEETCNLNLLRRLLKKAHRKAKEVDDFLEIKDGDRYGSLAYQLANLGARQPAFLDKYVRPANINPDRTLYRERSHFVHSNDYFKGELRYMQIDEANWADFVKRSSTKPLRPIKQGGNRSKSFTVVRSKYQTPRVKKTCQGFTSQVRRDRKPFPRYAAKVPTNWNKEGSISGDDTIDSTGSEAAPSGLQVAFNTFFT
jgi:hypothetical protein